MKALNENIGIFEDQLIGKGSTGNVYLGQSLKQEEKKLAIKAIDLAEINNEVTQYLLSCEIVALSELAKQHHENIVQLEDIFFTDKYCYLAMEILEGGPLTDLIKNSPDGIEEHEALSLFSQMF
jgi:serine/threonine-protein kinase CLA4